VSPSICLGLVADDVTGAGDASVQFAKRGWETFLVLGSQPVARTGVRPQVLAVTTDSRALSNESAEQLTFAAVTHLINAGIDRVFIKIDSTMRGSVPGQVAGALAAWHAKYAGCRAVVCPAYPRMGRTVQDGRLLVHGEPVERTAIGRDPVTPVMTGQMTTLLPPSPFITIADAATEDELNAVASGIAAGGPGVIAVGSGGLAEAMAHVLSAVTGATPVKIPDVSGRSADRARANARMLLLVSSLNPVSHGQVTRLRQAFPRVVVILPPDARQNSSNVAEALAAEFSALVERERWDAVGLIGGDGARAALARLGASGIRIEDSVVEGIPRGVIVGGRADGLRVFTKAGGFGGEDALVRAVERMSA